MTVTTTAASRSVRHRDLVHGDKYADLAGKLYAALGGHDNITEIENCILRLEHRRRGFLEVGVGMHPQDRRPGVKVIDKKNVQIIVRTQVHRG